MNTQLTQPHTGFLTLQEYTLFLSFSRTETCTAPTMLSIERRKKKKKKKKEVLDSDFQQKPPSRQQQTGSHEGQEKESKSPSVSLWEHSSRRHTNTQLTTSPNRTLQQRKIKNKEKQMLWNKTKILVLPKHLFRKFTHTLNVWYYFVLQCKTMLWKSNFNSQL